MKSPQEISAQRLISLFQKKYGMRMLSLAYHAALPVVITPELLHLIRINFFFEQDVALPYNAEVDLLFSDLCQEVDKKFGLYEFEQVIRELLLKGLQHTYGAARIREVAALLYQYSDRNAPWVQRVELERAQQLTALNFLMPEKAIEWLQEAEKARTVTETVNERWFVAVRKKLIVVDDLIRHGEESFLLSNEVKAKLINSIRKEWIDNPNYKSILVEQKWRTSRTSTRESQSLELGAADAFGLLQGRAVILGEPGMGKTVALVQIAEEEINRLSRTVGGRIPVILRLNEYPSTSMNMQKWLASEISTRYQIPLAIADDLIRANELTFLLDGLDEAKTPISVVDAINDFMNTQGGARVAVTCRTLSYSQLPKLNLNGEIYPIDTASMPAATKSRYEKTVFICYRRTNLPWALAIYQYLTAHGFDIFFDYQSIASGDFEQIILENIRSRAHFLVLLTPSTLERSTDPNDWLRREIETAMGEKRNIVPIFLDGFDFGSSSSSQYLTGKLADLRKYNGLNVPPDYFEQAMDRLVGRYLMPTEGSAKISSAAEFFNLGRASYENQNFQSALSNFDEAISIDPSYSRAYYYRGITRYTLSRFEEAIADFTKAIELNPSYDDALVSRGDTYAKLKMYDEAIEDYSRAVQLNPQNAETYENLGNAHNAVGKYPEAIENYSKAIEINPNSPATYANRGKAYANAGRYESSLVEYEKAIELDATSAAIYSKDLAEIRQKLQGRNANEAESPIILVAENDGVYRRTLRELLESTGYKVIEASSTAMALEMLRANDVDLALIDLRLTDDTDADDTSGFEVAQVASQVNTSCIIMTSFPSYETVRRALGDYQGRQLAQDYISKQDGPTAILNSIERLISRSDSEISKPKPGNRVDLDENFSNEFSVTSNISELPHQEWLKHFEDTNKKLGSFRSASVFERWSYYWKTLSEMEEFFDTADLLRVTREIIDVFQNTVLSIIDGIRRDNRDNPTEVRIIVMSVEQLLASLRQVRDGLLACSRLFEKDGLNLDNSKKFINTVRQVGEQLTRAKNTFTLKTSSSANNNLYNTNEIRFRKQSIGLIIHETQRRFQSVATDQNLKIRVSIRGDKEKQLEISPHHIQLALDNIVQNAIKYSTGGNSKKTRFIEIRGYPERDRYAIQVSNYGIGIGVDEIKNRSIFQPFYRGKNAPTKNRTGEGIGLAYARQVIEVMHHGTIEVKDQLLPGAETSQGGLHLTTFILWLPYSQPK